MRLRRNAMAEDPFQQFDDWYRTWRELTDGDPTAMTLATASASGEPSARVVLLKGWSPEGFLFFTNRESRKGRDMAENPRAALCFHWPDCGRQVRVRGTITEVDREVSREYFHSRPRGSQLGAVVSRQSLPLARYEDLATALREARQAMDGQEIPLPEHWGGYRLTPREIEFWQNGQDRLHDRFLYSMGSGGWALQRLNP